MNPEPVRFTLADLARRFDLRLEGDGNVELTAVGTLDDGGPEDLSFLSNPAYREKLRTTGVGAVILKADDAANCPVPCLVADDPYVSYALIAREFDHRPVNEPGIHATAVVADSAVLGKDVHVGAGAVIGEHCKLGDTVSIGAGAVIAEGCSLGSGTRIKARAILCDGAQLGRRVIVHPGAIIGADGFGLAFAKDHWEKIPQLGSVVIGDDCEIGANTCIDRGAIGNTVLEEDVRIDNLCQIGHNCHIGAHTAMAAFTGIAGSTRIGRFCMFGGRSGAHGHLEIADRTTVAATSTIARSVTEPGTTWSSDLPARPIRQWHRIQGLFNRLNDMNVRLRNIEKNTGDQQIDE